MSVSIVPGAKQAGTSHQKGQAHKVWPFTLAQHLSTSNLRQLIIYNLVTCVPFRQVIFKWGQVETEIYLPCGQEDFNFFPFPARLGIVQGA